MKAVLKAQLPKYLTMMAGAALTIIGWRIYHQRSPLDWSSAYVLVGITIVFVIYILVIWNQDRSESSATD
jgi:hypothetical protein